MKEIPTVPANTLELMQAFASRISKRKNYYSQFKPILQQEFSHMYYFVNLEFKKISTNVSVVARNFWVKASGLTTKKARNATL